MNSRIIRLLLAAFACTWTLACAAPLGWTIPAARADASDVDAAQQMYDESRFADAVKALRGALDSGRVTGSDAARAKELLARCLVKTGDAAGARRTFLDLLRQDPSYRPNAVNVPPDEMQVYDAARRVFDSEQRRASERIPASIMLFYGAGSGDNKDFGKFVQAWGGPDHYDNKPMFGGSVRFPLAPRLSLELELSRFRATAHDTVSAPNTTEFTVSAIPLSASLHWLLVQDTHFRASVFGGGGPMLQSRSALDLPFFSIRIEVADTKVGTYLQGGLEGEYLFHPRLSLAGRVLGRYAKATGLFKGTDITAGPNSVPIANRDVDFSGFGASIGLRAYIGY